MNKEILEFLRLQIPIILDIEKEELVYDKNNNYYKLYKYILELENKLKEKEKIWFGF